jgi:hypothetical protein
MSNPDPEFREIAHCGRQFLVSLKTEGDRRGISFGVRHSRPVPAAFFGVYALPEGIAVATIRLGGIGQPWNPKLHPSCVPVFIGSDSEGMFGHECPQCEKYWRAPVAPDSWNMTCPYCGVQASTHMFLTAAQKRFVVAWMAHIEKTIDVAADGDFALDMDAVADEATRGGDIYSEQSQQNKFQCHACGAVNDILGQYGYCCCCGTRSSRSSLSGRGNASKREIPQRIASAMRWPDSTASPDSTRSNWLSVFL